MLKAYRRGLRVWGVPWYGMRVVHSTVRSGNNEFGLEALKPRERSRYIQRDQRYGTEEVLACQILNATSSKIALPISLTHLAIAIYRNQACSNPLLHLLPLKHIPISPFPLFLSHSSSPPSSPISPSPSLPPMPSLNNSNPKNHRTKHKQRHNPPERKTQPLHMLHPLPL